MKTKFFLFLLLVAATQLKANNMLVKNVTTTGDNAANKTIQVQFDMSWDNSWRDAINWDAAWVFMKFKNANGLWQHVQLNTSGFANGTGTANTIQVGSDKVGAFVYRSAIGTGTFASTSMQLQWNYGLSGLTSVTGLEVRVFAVEMVYVPQGDFTVKKYLQISYIQHCYDPNGYQNQDNYNCTQYSSGGNSFNPLLSEGSAVINSRLSPSIWTNDNQYSWSGSWIKIKGNSGIDYNNDGVVENSNYPIGFSPFYCYKYEMSEQQYADFLNTLTTSQITGLRIGGSNISISNGQYITSTPDKIDHIPGFKFYYEGSGMTEQTVVDYLNYSLSSTQIATEGLAGSNIFISNGQYYSSTPNNACGNGNAFRMLSYADWSGLRPISFLEFQKACNGPFMPTNLYSQPGGSYYGIKDLLDNLSEPCVRMFYKSFTNSNGNGIIGTNAEPNLNLWNYDETTTSSMIGYIGSVWSNTYPSNRGFRYVRSAE